MAKLAWSVCFNDLKDSYLLLLFSLFCFIVPSWVHESFRKNHNFSAVIPVWMSTCWIWKLIITLTGRSASQLDFVLIGSSHKILCEIWPIRSVCSFLKQKDSTQQVHLLLVRAQVSNQSPKLGWSVVVTFIHFTGFYSARCTVLCRSAYTVQIWFNFPLKMQRDYHQSQKEVWWWPDPLLSSPSPPAEHARMSSPGWDSPN